MNIKDIAKLAGVSVATVSRVLNHPEVVQLSTRNHVLKIMKEHNYTPNWFARSLNLDRTNTLALMIPNIENEMFQKITAGCRTKHCGFKLCKYQRPIKNST